MKKIVVAIVAVLMFASCKDEKASGNQTTTEVAETKVKDVFSIEVEAEASKKDDFSFYYTEDGTNDFSELMVIWKSIKGGAKEKVVLDAPENIVPTNIRLDFGINKSQDYVIVYSIKAQYAGKDFSFKGSEFFNYFIKSDSFKSEIDANAGTIKFVKDGSEYKTPFFYPRQELIDALAKLTHE